MTFKGQKCKKILTHTRKVLKKWRFWHNIAQKTPRNHQKR
jgi:hypothetical protein